MANFLESLFGKKGETYEQPLYTPQQEDYFNEILSQGRPGLNKGLQFLQRLLGGEEGSFEPIAEEARRGFMEKDIPSIAERFTSMGAQKSSAFPQLLSQGAANLESQLGSQRAQYGLQQRGQQLQALQALQSLLQPALQQRTQTMEQPASYGLLGNLLASAAPGLGSGLGYLGGMKAGRGLFGG